MKLTEEQFYQFARRYFVMNAFDGALTILGVVMGSFVLGVSEPISVILVGISVSVGMAVSGIGGTFLTELAERKRGILEIEKAMLIKLDKSILAKSRKKEAVLLALIDGLSPFVSAVFILGPFWFSVMGWIAIAEAYKLAFVVTAVVLGALGVFLGKTSKTSVVKSALLMLAAGALTAAINMALKYLS